MLLWLPARRRGWRNLLVLFALSVALAFGVSACGGGGSMAGSQQTAGSSGTIPGNYTLAITGTSGSTSATTTINLTVQ